MKWLLFLIVNLFIIQVSFSQVVTVGLAGNFSTITQAVEEAASGDTVLVNSGLYMEGDIYVTKPLILIGLDEPVVDGGGKLEIFIVSAPNVTIEGFHLQNTGKSSIVDLAGIKGLDSHKITIRNNVFEDTFFGIHISNGDSILIENNKLTSSAEHEYQLGNGVHLWKCRNTVVAGNTVRGHRDGFYYEFVINSLTKSNISIGNRRYGLHFMFSHDAEYFENYFKDNGAGVAVMYTHTVKMHHNIFEYNWGNSSYGMLLKDIADSEVVFNRFTGNTSGIFVDGVSRTVFDRNLFETNGYAIKLMGSSYDNVFKKNNFFANTFDVSTNSNLELNKFEENYWDKYSGYDLNKDGIGDIPFYPVNLFSVITERIPPAIILWRSFLVFLLDKAEKVIPAITPENLKDDYPMMNPYDIF